MATEAPRLSEEQRELVAIGASIGAGCHRCLDHHLKIAARTELAADRVAAATASATSVAAIATERLSTHVRTSPDPANAGSATPLDRELAAFGAAIGANDLEGIERHLHAAAALGMCAARLREAVDVAEKVQQNAGRLHVNEAKRLIAGVGAEAAPTNEDTGESCGCDEDAAAQQPANDAVEGCGCDADTAAQQPAGDAVATRC